MTDWAKGKAYQLSARGIYLEADTMEKEILQALREARAKGIEEAADFLETDAKNLEWFDLPALAWSELIEEVRKLKNQP